VITTSELSPIQMKTFRAIKQFIEQNGYPPTVGELASSLSKTKASIHANLDSLMSKGFIRRTMGKARSLEIICSPNTTVIDLVAIPMLGNVTAGIPITAEENRTGDVLIEASIIGKDSCFALEVSGDSMIEADILEGDVLVVRQQPLAADGEIVVAAIDGEVTVKRLNVQRNAIKLLPENSSYSPIEVTHTSDFKILGKVIATRRVVAAARS
jgi:repressor LexA